MQKKTPVDAAYDAMTKRASPPSEKGKNALKAFLSGGLVCCFAQLLFDFYGMLGLNEKEVKAAVPITLIVLTAILTGLGLFGKLAKFAGAGLSVPITGFANSVVSPAMEFQTEGRVLGTGAKMFTLAGPVIAYGCSAAAVYGLIYYFFIVRG
ncbi:MAG: stage V sporulation protein AC [Clostridia bacterium]|nr:stage V sporulation protein AC [Clostridia bacterium]